MASSCCNATLPSNVVGPGPTKNIFVDACKRHFAEKNKSHGNILKEKEITLCVYDLHDVGMSIKLIKLTDFWCTV